MCFSPPLPDGRVDDDAYVEEHYYPHLVDVITQATGATLVFPYDHVRRHGATGEA